ncbi:MAG: molybdopterin cofactor-binding domain-containing protein [Gemmatimonadota bacterium]
MAKVSRRGFLITGGLVGGGLVLGYAVTPLRLGMTPDADAAGGDLWLTTWIRISPDNWVTVLVPHAEMGQGVHTALPMMAAEEMEADWSRVRMEQAPAEDLYLNEYLVRGFGKLDQRLPGFLKRQVDYAALKVADVLNVQTTGGSSSVRFTGHMGMRTSGAAAKHMLVRAAADRWGVPAAECLARLSQVRHDASGRSASFGELASEASLYDPPSSPVLKSKSDYSICGLPIPRIDIPSKVDGRAEYGIDVRLPEMRYAAIRHSPVFGAHVLAADDSTLAGSRGIESVVRIPGAVAVVADNFWRARKAADELPVEWTDSPHKAFSSERLSAEFEEMLDDGRVRTDQRRGNPDLPGGTESFLVEAEYDVPFLAHATMEPMSCTAWLRDGKLDVWTGTQDPVAARATAAKAAGIRELHVTVHPVQLGGGFGRRLPANLNYVTEAVQLAAQVPYPVKVIWTREEDMRHGYYRPAVRSRHVALLGMAGSPDTWRHTYTDIGLNELVETTFLSYSIPYSIPNQRIGHIKYPRDMPVPASPWRSVEHSYHGFFIESFIDELAHETGQDPLAYRLQLLREAPRFAAALEKAAEMIDWHGSRPHGHGHGIAVKESFGSIVAEAAEVSVGSGGDLRVHRVCAAVDCGEVINPDIARAQIEGGINFALSAVLYGEITIEAGRVVQGNFPDYRMVTLRDAPDIQVEFLESRASIGGIGEVGVPPLAPAVTNAIFVATGQRIRSLPIGGQTLKPAPRA